MNHYRAVERLPEHGGNWVFMCLNKREGGTIVCGCSEEETAWGWECDGHVTQEGAERCLYNKEMSSTIYWSEQRQAEHCVQCGEWTPWRVHVGHILTFDASVCKSHDDGNDEGIREMLRIIHPFHRGFEVWGTL